MKSCTYCGKQYPDDATACEVDGQPLTESGGERTKITGVWRGAYGYASKSAHEGIVVRFTLKLKQGWLGHFKGEVTEDPPEGALGTGFVDGYFGNRTIEFTKQMPVGYIRRPDGTRVSMREYFIEHGHGCEQELPGSPISYEGAFLEANRVQGVWIIRPGRISLPDGWGMDGRQSTGLWCAEFVTPHLNETPTGGPKQPYFDKSLLPSSDVMAEANSGFRRLGRFSVADAERILARFEQENIRYEVNRSDEPMRQMGPITAALGGYYGGAAQIQLLVHPDDEAKARAIINEDIKV